MRVSSPRGQAELELLPDGYVDALLRGDLPGHESLAVLSGFVASLRGYAGTEVGDDFIAYHAGVSAASIADSIEKSGHLSNGSQPKSSRRIRSKALSVAASFAMVVGMTGLAWAGEAEPGDWNYGLQQALESLGFEFGNGAETVTSLEAGRSEEGNPGQGDSGGPASNGGDASGLLNAAGRVVGGGEAAPNTSVSIREEISQLLLHIYGMENVDGRRIAELARQIAAEHRPEQASPEDPGKPDDPGKP